MELGPVLASLRRAVEQAPEDAALRAHLAALLLEAGLVPEAIGHLGVLLARDPGDPQAAALMRRAIGDPTAAEPAVPGTPVEESGPATFALDRDVLGAADPAGTDGFDWGAAEQDLTGGLAHEPISTTLRLADVGGLEEVKAELEAAFLAPLRHPALRERYGATMRGGLLLYGPPGCGKTHLARAVAGELGARFVAVSLADVLSAWQGRSEGNVAELFGYGRAQAPCLVFLDELDALGRSRGALGRSGSALRGVVNQLLTELDGVAGGNEGVFVLGASNAPWDIDPALRRPGRMDRTLFVGPPDAPARAAILASHLTGLPLAADVDVADLAARTAGLSGADLALVCRRAAQAALLDATRSGDPQRPVTAADLHAALVGVTPSTGAWFATARNVVLFGEQSGEYAAVAAYLREHRML